MDPHGSLEFNLFKDLAEMDLVEAKKQLQRNHVLLVLNNRRLRQEQTAVINSEPTITQEEKSNCPWRKRKTDQDAEPEKKRKTIAKTEDNDEFGDVPEARDPAYGKLAQTRAPGYRVSFDPTVPRVSLGEVRRSE